MSRRLVRVESLALLAALLTIIPLPGCGPEQNDPPVVDEEPEREPEPDPDPHTLSTTELLNLLERIPKNEFVERVRILEIVVEREPENRSAQLMLMNAAELQGMQLADEKGARELWASFLDQAARAARAVLEMDEPLTDEEREFAGAVFYNEACSLALDNEAERAIESLRLALELGFDEPIIHDDPDLDSLRNRDDFRRLMATIPEPPETQEIDETQDIPSPIPGEVESPTVDCWTWGNP